MDRCKGVSLVELVCALTLVGVLAALATPMFKDVSLNAARTAAVNGFFHALFLARSEAIKRNTVVSICRSLDGATCATRSAEWTVGWIVFVNPDRDQPAERDAGEEVLSTYDGWRTGTISSNRLTYSFRPHNQSVVNGTILFCDPRGPDHSRAIIISHTGRPRVAQRDSKGKPLNCPPQE